MKKQNRAEEIHKSILQLTNLLNDVKEKTEDETLFKEINFRKESVNFFLMRGDNERLSYEVDQLNDYLIQILTDI